MLLSPVPSAIPARLLWAFVLVLSIEGAATAGPSYYPRCPTVLPEKVHAQFFKGWVPEESSNCDTCPTICHFENKKLRSVASVVYVCDEASSKTPPDNKPPAGATPIKGLGRSALRRVEKKATHVVEVWDDDSPCKLVVRWQGVDARKKVMDLAQAATAAATREAVTRPVFDAIIWNETRSPEVAKKWQDSWGPEAKLLDRLVQLAPGYPRVVEGRTVPGLQDAQTFVLGYCPAPEGAALVSLLESINQSVYTLRVELPADAASCPRVLNQVSVEKGWVYTGNNRELGVGLYSFTTDGGTTGSKEVTQLIASLRDTSGNLLDARQFPPFIQQEPMDPPCETSFETLKRGWVARTRCPVGTACERPGETLYTHTITLGADGGIQIDAGVRENRADCSPGD
jgi:hypothetical protein